MCPGLRTKLGEIGESREGRGLAKGNLPGCQAKGNLPGCQAKVCSRG